MAEQTGRRSVRREPGRHTQEDRSRATRAALIATARGLFTERGYADVSSAEIVAAAGLSRGALYHHYSDKRDLFRAVFVELEAELAAELKAAAAGAGEDTAAGMLAALDTFLSACERDEVVRIGLTDAPAVLGWQAWREIETEHGLGLLLGLLDHAMATGLLPRLPTQVLAQLMLSTVIEAALLVASADPGEERARVRIEVRQALLAMLPGLNPVE